MLPKYQAQINMEEQIVSAHVRSLIQENLTHIDSSNSQQVEPWFNGKVDFVAKAKDLNESGFKLVGGRLDYVNKTNAASIVYQIGDHIINLFIFPSTEEDIDIPKNFQNRGYNIVKWVNNGLEYCAISDLNLQALNQFAKLFRENQVQTLSPDFTAKPLRHK